MVNGQRPKLKLQVNSVEIEGLVVTGADVTIMFPRSWNSEWPLQNIHTQFIGTDRLSQIKQSVQWVKCVGPEGKTGKLRPYVTDIPINLWGRDFFFFLQQCGTQIFLQSQRQLMMKL